MVILVIFTIFLMMVERYINRTNTKKIIKEKRSISGGSGVTAMD